jgi:hypothetical protein
MKGLIHSLVLGALVVSLKDRPESYWSMRIVQATRIAPSLWPILFSGILGNAVRHFANWRVERGVPLLVRGHDDIEDELIANKDCTGLGATDGLTYC